MTIRFKLASLAAAVLIVGAAGLGTPSEANAARLKELVDVEGFRDNPLVGYGLVVGLQGTGDNSSDVATRQSLSRLMNHLGIEVQPDQIKAKNVAAVIITARLPPFAKPGATINVTVSSMSSAKSLQGGTLIATPLKGADRNTYAVAQGSLSLGGFSVDGASGGSTKKNHATVGKIPGGGVLERAAPGTMPSKRVTLLLRDADFTTATRTAKAINGRLGASVARVRDAGTVDVRITKRWRGHVAALVATLESVDVTPDAPARVVIDERTGTVVVGAHVTLGEAAIAHGGITVKITEKRLVSQPGGGLLGGGSGDTAVVPDTEIEVTEGEGRLHVLPEAANVGDVAAALNALGVKPRDLVSIFQALQIAGALRAEIKFL
ncbi:MAG: flagellar basal body P-ring protein FlgI [Nannocystaceae bacterium]|nr:flagellar basal body P-ring protein FlgI [Nannocystaceae bacterium]